jgi:lysophospholipase L1-like esterase
VLTFGGRPDALVAPGAPLVSDPVDLPVQALSSLAVTLYLPKATGPCTCHGTGMQIAYVGAGDQAAATTIAAPTPLPMRAFLSGVEVSGPTPAKTVVVLGDSISDGVGSTVDQNRRWPDLLAERLAARGGKAAWGVSNEGISGNRVLNDGAGVSALARLDRDVLATPGAAYVIVFEGINDIGLSNLPAVPAGPLAEWVKRLAVPVTADDIIQGYKQIIARAHADGLKIYGATITPFEGAPTYNPEGEAKRQAVNAWIRTSGAFDAVLDFDAAIRDPQRPTQMRDGFHMGDHLHGSDAGYRAIADSIDLNLFN